MCQGNPGPARRGAPNEYARLRSAHVAYYGCEKGTMLQVVSHGDGNACTLKKVAPADQAEVKAQFDEQAAVSGRYSEHTHV